MIDLAMTAVLEADVQYDSDDSMECITDSEVTSDVCVCSTIKRKPLAQLAHFDSISRGQRLPTFINEARIISFRKSNVPTLDPYDVGLKETYFEQTFFSITEIGYGSFGKVFAATSKSDGQRYAIKRSHDVYRSRMNRLSKLREVQMHELLPPHPNIVQFFCAWEENDRLFIQLELCDKQMSLADIRQCRKCSSIDSIWSWTADLLNALSLLSDLNIIHMDVKPANIFVMQDNHCKLGDFGTALNILKDNLDDVDEGEGKYAAPEILNNPPTKAADMYSLGMTMLEVASNCDLPTHGDELQKIREGKNQVIIENIGDAVFVCLIYMMINLRPLSRPLPCEALKIIESRHIREFTMLKRIR